MGKRTLFGLAVVTAAVMALAGCGCSSGSGGSHVSSGAITGYGTQPVGGADSSSPGAIVVNGVEYRISGARIRIRGASYSRPGDLKVGMVVTVRGHLDANGRHGSATEIEYHEHIDGPVAAISGSGSRLTVLGQTVRVGATTIFAGIGDPGTLAVGDMVEISGLPAADGAIVATRIEKRGEPFVPGVTETEIVGTVTGVAAGSFTINDLTVTAAGPLPPGLTVGDPVEVEGTLAAPDSPLAAIEVVNHRAH